MVWVSLIIIWFLQLRLLTSVPWFGIVWPLFTVIILLISLKLDKYKLSWILLLMGVLADVSSHLAPGVILKGYIFLIAAIWAVPLLNEYLSKIKYAAVFKFLLLILLVDLFYILQSTSWSSLFLSLKHEIFLISVMTFIILGFASLFKNIFWRKNEQA